MHLKKFFLLEKKNVQFFIFYSLLKNSNLFAVYKVIEYIRYTSYKNELIVK